jgi:hypothetical protein
MKILSTLILLVSFKTLLAQTPMNAFVAGHAFKVSLPVYMQRTIGYNDDASIQFKNSVKDVYGFIIEDNKDEMKLAEIYYTSINEFYTDFTKDFLVDEKKRTLSSATSTALGEFNFMVSELSYFDKEAKTMITYFIGIAETKAAFYKMLCWTTTENKDTYKADFEKILFSIND